MDMSMCIDHVCLSYDSIFLLELTDFQRKTNQIWQLPTLKVFPFPSNIGDLRLRDVTVSNVLVLFMKKQQQKKTKQKKKTTKKKKQKKKKQKKKKKKQEKKNKKKKKKKKKTKKKQKKTLK